MQNTIFTEQFLLSRPMVKLQAWVGNGLLTSTSFFCEVQALLCTAVDQCIVVTEGTTVALYAEQVARGFSAELLFLPGEFSVKSLEAKSWVEEQLEKRGGGRHLLLIAVGGGALCDLIGFVAATYLRGVKLLLIPTTLLAMIDAAIGGKTAIDTPYGKNRLGSFYHAHGVVCELSTLDTLSEEAMLCGIAELIKLALVAAPELLPLLQPPLRCEELILPAMRAKWAIVREDPEDCSVRHLLNFGQTIGHALEALSRYTMAHGYAVAIGWLTESYLSNLSGLLSTEEFTAIEALYRLWFGGRIQKPLGYSCERMLSLMERDKKNRERIPHFVLLTKQGAALHADGRVSHPVDRVLVEASVAFMEGAFV